MDLFFVKFFLHLGYYRVLSRVPVEQVRIRQLLSSSGWPVREVPLLAAVAGEAEAQAANAPSASELRSFRATIQTQTVVLPSCTSVKKQRGLRHAQTTTCEIHSWRDAAVPTGDWAQCSVLTWRSRTEGGLRRKAMCVHLEWLTLSYRRTPQQCKHYPPLKNKTDVCWQRDTVWYHSICIVAGMSGQRQAPSEPGLPARIGIHLPVDPPRFLRVKAAARADPAAQIPWPRVLCLWTRHLTDKDDERGPFGWVSALTLFPLPPCYLLFVPCVLGIPSGNFFGSALVLLGDCLGEKVLVWGFPLGSQRPGPEVQQDGCWSSDLGVVRPRWHRPLAEPSWDQSLHLILYFVGFSPMCWFI